MKGLPIGRGLVWDEPDSRRLLVMAAVLGLVPLLALGLVAAGVLAPSTYVGWVLIPVVGLAACLVTFAQRHFPAVFRRMAIGVLAGLGGVLAYDGLFLYGVQAGLFPAMHPVWAGLVPDDLAATLGGYFGHWFGTGALWGMAYALVAGRARWYYGPAYGAIVWGLVALFATRLPGGHLILPGTSFGMLAVLLAGHLVYGAVLGAVNQAAQPDERLGGKIIFLRDHKPRVKSRR